MSRLLAEYEVDGQYQAGEAGEMVPAQGVALHEDECEEREDQERNDLLNDFELPYGEWASESCRAQAVGGYLKAVLEQCDAPTQDHDGDHAEALDFRFEGYVTIPCEGHEGVRDDKKCY